MNNAGQILLYLLILVTSLAMGNWFYNNFAWVNEEKEVGFQGIAQTNKLLASEFFLRKMGIKVQQVNGLVAFRDLPSAKHTLLIATQRETINKELSQKLLNWVRSGGHLIVEARIVETGSSDEAKESSLIDDNLLEEFVIFAENNSNCGCKDNSSNETNIIEEFLDEAVVNGAVSDDSTDDSADIPISFSLMNDINSSSSDEEIKVNFPYELSLKKGKTEPQLSWLVKDGVGQYLMQFSLEQGILTVLTSTSIFNNEQIAQYDHALFLHYLVQQQGHNAGVWLIRVDDMPPLWQWLWTNAWYLMFSLSFLLFLWLWRAPLRFGPLLNDEPTERRSLLEHIQASGYYRWHHKQSGYLLAKVQDVLWVKIQTSHPAVHRENELQAYVKLEEITGIEASLIKQALMVVEHVGEQEFLKRIRMLEVIGKKL